MPEQELQTQQQTQQQQGPEGPGMARSFSENPSMEMLRERRIDQLVAKKEAERNAIAQGMKQAEHRGISIGEQVGSEKGFNAGHSVGLEGGYRKGFEQGSLGLGRSLPVSKSEDNGSESAMQEEQGDEINSVG